MLIRLDNASATAGGSPLLPYRPTKQQYPPVDPVGRRFLRRSEEDFQEVAEEGGGHLPVRHSPAASLPTRQDLTPELLLALYLGREWSMRQIAVLYGFAQSSIRKRLLAQGAPIRPSSAHGHPPRVAVDLLAAVAALKGGASMAEAAEGCLVSAQTLRRRLAEEGLIPAKRARYDRGEEVGR